MGDVFYRGICPSNMGYTELRYYGDWHARIVQAELDAHNKGGK